MNEAAILAARNNRRKILMSDCEEAIDRVLMGPSAGIGCSLNGTRRYLHIMKQATLLLPTT